MTMTKEMKKELKKQAERDEKRKKHEEHKAEREKKKQEQDAIEQAEKQRLQDAQDKIKQDEEKKRKKQERAKRKFGAECNELRRKALAILRNVPEPVVINDEDTFKDFGLIITRQPIASSYNCVVYPVTVNRSSQMTAAQRYPTDIGQVVVKVVMLDKCFSDFRKNLVEQALKTIKYLGQPDPSEPSGAQMVHRSMVRVLDVFCSDNKAYIFMERLPTKTLEDKVRIGEGLSIEQIIKSAREIGEALFCLNLLGFAHLSVRVDNFVVDDQEQIRMVGLCRIFVAWNSINDTVIRHPRMHEPPFRTHFPPEVYRGDFDPMPVDVFCFGALIFQLAVRERPFRKLPPLKGKEDMKEVWEKQCKSMHNEMRVLPDELRALLTSMMAVSKPEERITLDNVLSHEFFQEGFVQTWWASPAKKHFPNTPDKDRSSKSKRSKKSKK